MVQQLENLVREFLESVASNTAPRNDALIEDFGERCKMALVRQLYDNGDREFRVRMSNIGKDLRQLHLEKMYGRGKKSPEFIVKMLIGDITEAAFLYFIKASGEEVQTDGKVSLNVAGEQIDGTYDLKFRDTIVDIKSASPSAYEYKFTDVEKLKEKDDFGYIGQGHGYSLGSGSPFSGWFVINKSTGEFKGVPANFTVEEIKDTFMNFEYKIKALKNGEIPACDGVIPETFRGKPTGNRILSYSCGWCNHKTKCHTNVSLEPSRVSQAKTPKLEWYVD